MGIRKMVGVLLAIGFASLNLAIAQTAVDGAIGGNVKDGSGAFVAGAKVTVHNNGTGAEQSTISDDSGFFRVIHMLPGSYTVTVSAPGFRTYKADQVSVTVGSLTDLEPSLALGSTSETVEITSDAPAINTTNNDFTTTIGLKDLEDLPVNNYRWSAYALQAPGVVESGEFGLLGFRGQSTLLNNMTERMITKRSSRKSADGRTSVIRRRNQRSRSFRSIFPTIRRNMAGLQEELSILSRRVEAIRFMEKGIFSTVILHWQLTKITLCRRCKQFLAGRLCRHT